MNLVNISGQLILSFFTRPTYFWTLILLEKVVLSQYFGSNHSFYLPGNSPSFHLSPPPLTPSSSVVIQCLFVPLFVLYIGLNTLCSHSPTSNVVVTCCLRRRSRYRRKKNEKGRLTQEREREREQERVKGETDGHTDRHTDRQTGESPPKLPRQISRKKIKKQEKLSKKKLVIWWWIERGQNGFQTRNRR